MSKSPLLRHETQLEIDVQKLLLRFEADTGRRIQKLMIDADTESKVIIVGLEYYPELDMSVRIGSA